MVLKTCFILSRIPVVESTIYDSDTSSLIRRQAVLLKLLHIHCCLHRVTIFLFTLYALIVRISEVKENAN